MFTQRWCLAALALVFAGCAEPRDEKHTLVMRWKLTSNHYEFREHHHTRHHQSGKTTYVTHYSTYEWDWMGEKVREGADWKPSFPEQPMSTCEGRSPSVGDREIRNDEEEYYINGVYIGDDQAKFLAFRGDDITHVIVHTDQFGWRTVKPLVMEKPE